MWEKLSQQNIVGKTSAWSHTVSSDMIDPGFMPKRSAGVAPDANLRE